MSCKSASARQLVGPMLLPVPVPVPVGPRSSRCAGARGPLRAGSPPARPAGGLGRTAGLGAGARAADAARAGRLAKDSGRGAAVCWAMTTGLAAHAIANRGPSAAWTAEPGRGGRTTRRKGMVGPFVKVRPAGSGGRTGHVLPACRVPAQGVRALRKYPCVYSPVQRSDIFSGLSSKKRRAATPTPGLKSVPVLRPASW